jgi:hypothetical protein
MQNIISIGSIVVCAQLRWCQRQSHRESKLKIRNAEGSRAEAIRIFIPPVVRSTRMVSNRKIEVRDYGLWRWGAEFLLKLRFTLTHFGLQLTYDQSRAFAPITSAIR